MNNNSAGGIGFCGVLTLIFITLKLCGVIAWSWLWVLSPLWIGAIVALAICMIAVTLVLGSALVVLALGLLGFATVGRQILTDNDIENHAEFMSKAFEKFNVKGTVSGRFSCSEPNNSPFKKED